MIQKVLTFYMDKYLFGIDIQMVKEINRNMEVTPVPDSKNTILGLINLRGQIVTIFDLFKIIGISEQSEGANTSIILKGNQKCPDLSGFFIDQPGDVLDISVEDCEQPPANISDIETTYIDSIVKLKEELLIIIKPENIFV